VGGFSNGEVLVWQTLNRRLVARLHPNAPSGAAIAFSPGAQQLASTAYSDVIVWDLKHGTPRTSSERTGTSKLVSVALLPHLLSGPSGDVEFVAFSPDGTSLLFIRDSSTLFHWPLDRSIAPKEVIPTGGVVAFTSDGEMVTVEDVATLQDSGLVPLISMDSPNFETYAFSPNLELIAESYFDGIAVNNLRVRRTSDGQTLWKLGVNYPFGITFSPDGAHLAFSILSEIEVWRVRDWTLQYTLRIDGDSNLWSPTFSPDGQLLATAGSNGIIYLWRADDGRFLRTLEGHSGWIGDLAFSGDGTLLASTSADGTVRLWGIP
jgi:WD40 repeat protein